MEKKSAVAKITRKKTIVKTQMDSEKYKKRLVHIHICKLHK